MVASLTKAVVRGRKWSELCFETLRQSLIYLAKLKKEMRRSSEMHWVSRPWVDFFVCNKELRNTYYFENT
jgi:hypothetical protein